MIRIPAVACIFKVTTSTFVDADCPSLAFDLASQSRCIDKLRARDLKIERQRGPVRLLPNVGA
ncbi:MAG TPA: hypothetical protein VF169_14960 [Albitalea sp.]|uniref:hypothetical protein n=1 Tax=Piscinibacter sp. TaxID=1903157 RepID=UPI002ED451BE